VNLIVLADCIRLQFEIELSDFQESRVGKNGFFTGVGPDRGYTSINPNGPYEYAQSFPGNDARIEVVNEVSEETSAETSRTAGHPRLR